MTPWRSLLQPHDPLQILIVGPRPLHATTTIDTVHVMIEQRPHEGRAAAVISTLFHGEHEDRILQSAYSVQRWLCTEDIIDLLRINHICEVQRCDALSGVAHFQHHIRHDVRDAIGIEMHVKTPRCQGDQRAASSSELFVPRRLLPSTAASFLQVGRVTSRSTSTTHEPLQGDDDHVQPMDKVDGDFQQCRTDMQHIAARNEQIPALPTDQPHFVHDLHALLREQQVHIDGETNDLSVTTWYSDHERRPHSGLGRDVRLSHDVTRWYHDLVMIWDDWVDPFATLHGVIVHPRPSDGQVEVHAHIVLLQHVQANMCSVIVAIVDSLDDPWHPRMLCLTVPRILSHTVLCGYIDLDGICGTTARCRTLLGDRDLTDLQQFEVENGMHLVFHILREGVVLPTPVDSSVIHANSDEQDDAPLALLQTSARRQVLQLDSCIAPPRCTFVECQQVLFLRQQLCSGINIQPAFDVHAIWWHASTWSKLAWMPVWSTERAQGLTFYTDGSNWRSQNRAAAGVFLIVHTDEGMRFGGFLTTPCLTPCTAPRAEATALILAALWIAQVARCHHDAMPWFEIDDCEHTANIARASQTAHGNSDIHVVMRSLVQWLEIITSTQIHWTHHRSHQGDPWNEAADTICRHALEHGRYTLSLDDWFAMCTFQGSNLCPIQWVWLAEKSLRFHVDAPTLIGTKWRFDVSSPFASMPQADEHPVVLRKRQPPLESAPPQSFRLRVATANVLTLSPGLEHGSTILGARAEGLASQFLTAGIQIIGLQETRARMQGHSTFDSFHVLSGPATQKGQGGVQLWMRQSIWTSSGHIKVEISDLRILHATSRRLIVRWSYPGCRLLFAVPHAPSDDNEESLQSFWAATTKAIPEAYRHWKIIVLTDANSRIGSHTSAAIGPHQAENENIKGNCFHGWLQEHGLFVPQTFAECHAGHGVTWTHPTGTSARLDFIAVSDDIDLAAVSSWVSSDVDLTLHRRDHACVCADISLAFHLVDKRPRDARWQKAPSTSLDVYWALDVHTHAARLQQWMHGWNPQRRHWRKRHMSETTKRLIDAKRFHWKRLQTIGQHQKRSLLRQLFAAWRHPCTEVPHCHSWLKECDMAVAWHQGSFAVLAPLVVQAVREDDRAFYENLAMHAGEESTKGCQVLWKTIQPLLPRWRSKRRVNLRACGPSLEEQFDHFDQLEAGHCLEYETLLQQCHAAQKEDADDIPVQIQLEALPSRTDIEVLGCRIKTTRAPGLDSVAPPVLQQTCQQHSNLLHQFILKVWILGAEPLQGKGGLIHAIAKKQVSSRIEHMRGITLIDGLGKLVHSFLRGQFLPALEALRQPLQLGGFARRSTLFATLYVRSITQIAASQSLSSAVLFVDIKSAFHSMVRQIAFGGEGTLHPKLRQVLIARGFDLDALYARVCSPMVAGEEHLTPTTTRLLRDVHRHTWYALGAAEEVHQTERGSRPGSPLADIAFNTLMSSVLQELQEHFDQHPPLQAAFMQLGIRALPVAWVDDLAVPLVSLTADGLLPIAQWTIRTVVDVCASFGLEINLKPHKTEIVPAFRGQGASVCRRRSLLEQFARVPVPDSDQSVRIVPRYEHLGTSFQADGGIEAEVQHRVNKACVAYQQIHRAILKNRCLAIPTRLRLLEALVLPAKTTK